MITETKKIEITNQKWDFSKREKFINNQISELIELYNSDGYIVVSHSIKNKNNSGATVVFQLKRMPY